MSLSLRERIEEIVNNIISEEFFIIDISVSGAVHHKVTVLVDGDNGITIDKCAEISRSLGEELERAELINQNYVLEISSPGIDHPLKFLRQYKRNIGRKLKLLLKDETTKQGTLKMIKGDIIVIDEEVPIKGASGKVIKGKKALQEREILFEDIKKTNVIISFS